MKRVHTCAAQERRISNGEKKKYYSVRHAGIQEFPNLNRRSKVECINEE